MNLGARNSQRRIRLVLRTSRAGPTIDDSYVSGIIAVINDVYINQLKMTHEELSDMAIPSINDQSTNARIRTAKAVRTMDVNPFTQLQCFQLGFGLFHLSMNLVWALLHAHRGSLNEPGSLSYFFAVLDRTRLDREHPDYDSLLATLMQILRGVILNAWKAECGYATLAAFSVSNPTPEQLYEIANKILCNHVTPPLDPSRTQHVEPIDNVNRNLRILTRDLLYVLELTHAISDGDFGRVEDMLGYLVMVFRGLGSNNYCTEILHFIFNLKRIWTPEFADVMRDNMLVNPTGLEGHFMAVDLNTEHLVRFLKRFFAEGVCASGGRLGDASTVVDFQHIRTQDGNSPGISYDGPTRPTPDTDSPMQKISHKVNELAMHVVTPGRNTNTTVKPVVDALAAGERKLKSSALATFNRKVERLFAGKWGVEVDEDEIPPVSFDFTVDMDSDAEWLDGWFETLDSMYRD
ncbi:hypothetical protein OG21DRAFT_1513121 [Imleria badia]|nr:hypothetical protein OG21DRAFT_1513121 [Imleria badia]